MEKKMTAMEELIEYVEKYMEVLGMPAVMIKDKATNLLPKEREQIEEAFRAGQDSMEEDGKNFDQYYTQNYGQ